MSSRTALAVCLCSLLACAKAAPTWNGPVVARGDGVVITADEVRARLDEQPPSVRHAFQRPEGKRKFLDDVIRFEVLARAAAQEGLADDPEVQFALKKALIARYRKKLLQQGAGAASVPEAEARKFYDEHHDDFARPLQLHAALILVSTEADQAARGAKAGEARRLLDGILAAEPTNPSAFADAARRRSDDAETKPLGGDLGFRTREELDRFGKEVTEEALKLEPNQTSRQVVETPRGFFLVRLLDRQPEQVRRFDDARPQIAARLAEQRKDADFEARLRRLRDAASVTVDEAALDRIEIPLVPVANE